MTIERSHTSITSIIEAFILFRVWTEIESSENHDTSLDTRKDLSLKAFVHTAEYDAAISKYFRTQFGQDKSVLPLRYGMNPHQKPAQLYTTREKLPLTGE